MDVIRNKVAESDLIQLDLEQLIKLPAVVSLDMASFLEEGLFLKEKEFRSAIPAARYTSLRSEGGGAALLDRCHPPALELDAGQHSSSRCGN